MVLCMFNFTIFTKSRDISDLDRDSYLNRIEFIIAMHLAISRINLCEIPSSIPASLQASVQAAFGRNTANLPTRAAQPVGTTMPSAPSVSSVSSRPVIFQSIS